jgi:hypothetical protein
MNSTKLMAALGRIFTVLVALFCIGLTPAVAQPNLPPVSVYARAYAGWQLQGQAANTYSWNGAVCYYTPLQFTGLSPAFFDFSGSIAGSTVYNPVLIQDYGTPANSEIVTPTSTTNGASQCGFAGTVLNSHTTFVVQSGTVGLQEAVTAQAVGTTPRTVLLDPYWYSQVYALPGQPTPESIITAVKGATNVIIVDTTTSPSTQWRWTGSAYAATSLTGGSSAPTAAAGAAAGSGPTGPTNTGDGNTMSVALTTGTATTTGTLFTETWATSNAFLYPPSCYVWSSGTNSFTAFTYAVTYPSSTHALLTVTATSAPVASTAYAFKIVCN